MQGITNTNLAVQQNRQMYENLSKSNAFTTKPQLNYSNSTVQYYNDEKTIKKQKRKKAAKWLTLGFAGASILSIGILTTIGIIKGKHKDYIKAFKAHSQKFDLESLGFNKETIQKITNDGKNGLNKAINITTNLTNIKDDIARKVTDKVKAKKIGNYLKGWYNNMAAKGAKPAFEDAQRQLIGAIEIYKQKNHLAQEYTLTAETFDDFFQSISTGIADLLTKEGNETITQTLLEKNNKGKREIWKKLTGSIIANDKIIKIRQKHLIQDLPKEYLEDENIRNALSKYNQVINDVIDKSRDTNLGNAISDVTGMALSVGTLGLAVASEDDKEKRKSTILNLGIPLIVTLGTMIFGNLKNISGVKAILLGLGTGQLASMGAKAIDNTMNKNKEKSNLLKQ